MGKTFREYKKFDLSEINKDILARWKKDQTFTKSLTTRQGKPSFVFYEGPPSANGMPGIHHVISRTIKDIFCRFKTLQGYQVQRKAGWDTHGLPVELGVEKMLGITKEDIGEKITVAEYNETCRKEVMKFTKEWEDLTEKMGYWIDMDNPYITYDNRYIETVWYLLKELYNKDLLYKGYSIQPYSPAAGTGLSTHELNQPGCYRDVKDTTCVAQFKVIRNSTSEFLFTDTDTPVYFLAWTTTPWTLPSNTALAVGPNVHYVKVRTFNPYTHEPITVVLAKDLLNVYFNEKNSALSFDDYQPGDKNIPYKILAEYTGSDLKGIRYEQLIDWVKPEGNAFEVVIGDFVTTDEGTGIVHIAPTFGADDHRVAQQNGIASLVVYDAQKNMSPLVDKRGRMLAVEKMDPAFVQKYVNQQTYKDFSGRFVKNEYDESLPEDHPTLDVDISVMLKKENKAFRIEKYVHTYPHCWRTDKPVLYYPLESWFVKTTAVREKMMKLNDTIQWKPESTGTGRFGKWLENLVDWNLSRSRYWGTPLPIWRTEDKKQEKCIGSVAELKSEIEKAMEKGVMKENPLAHYKTNDYTGDNYTGFDLHRPTVDQIILVTDNGEPMFREADLIDVWFDSGAMPYAQQHYPFGMKGSAFENVFPADFIAEGVDQTRGWFFTLHAIASMLFDSVAYKNIISNGLVLDKKGNKMSKRLNNAIDPFKTIEEYGTDPLRWYMISNAQPWDNLKFDLDGVDEVKRKFFGTLYNTYSFFALYANIDQFTFTEKEIPVSERPKIDRWIISLLNSLIRDVENSYNTYEPTRAARLIQDFVIENLSNWYVRLNRKRYWGGEYTTDKIAAYQTLYTCLEVVAILASPIAPFFTDMIYGDLNEASGKSDVSSVHLANFPKADESLIINNLEEQMGIAQQMTSMILGLRRKVNIKVRQPLAKVMVPVIDQSFKDKFEAVQNLILNEVNVKEVDFITDTSGVLVKTIKPNFKTLGPKHGKNMKLIAAKIGQFEQDTINRFEKEGSMELHLDNGESIQLTPDDVEIVSQDIPGWLVTTEGRLTVALDIHISDELKQEGIAREFVNRIQNLRKESGFDVTDKITIEIQHHQAIHQAVNNFRDYIGAQTLANEIKMAENVNSGQAKEVTIDDNITTFIKLSKV
ncbi:MAG: isoleucine--tRNA ligase [Bacteroidetes bacterium]|jgi:isoleucyl-tRNA synthetase|nr:isoleucine--tRNA ligase [Bacteroidota bacterium]